MDPESIGFCRADRQDFIDIVLYYCVYVCMHTEVRGHRTYLICWLSSSVVIVMVQRFALVVYKSVPVAAS